MKRFFVLPLVAAVLFSCSENSNSNRGNGEYVSAISADDMTDSERMKEIERIQAEEKKRIEEEEANVTTLTFDKLRHDFGDIPNESEVSTEFVVTNTGKKPLIIEDVKASCGCTTPRKPEKPINPGDSDVITVTFKPKPDQKNEIIKTVTVTANTMPRISTLTIRSFVK